MNVIRQPKRVGSNAVVRGRPSFRSKGRGGGRGALDFDIIQFRPGQRSAIISSSDGEVRTPSNLELQMAISSSAHRTSSTTIRPGSGNNSSSSFTTGRSLITKPSFPSLSSTASYSASSSPSIVTPRQKIIPPPKTPHSNFFTPKSTPRATPTSTSTGGDQNSSHVVLAITEGRGHARGEVGIAVIDIKRPKLTLCQLSDRQTYANTLTKISVFQPVEILIPKTFVESNQPNKLYNFLEERFPHVNMTKVQRRLFRDSEGLEKVQYLCLPENSSCQLIIQDKFYALAAAAALLKYVEFVQNIIFASHSLKIEYQGAHHGTIIDVKTAKNLELLLNQQSNNTSHTLIGMMDQCSTHGGSRMLRASLLHPPCSLPTIIKRQDGVQELVENPERGQKIREVLQHLPDVEQLLTLCMQTPSTIDSTQSIETRVNYVLMLKTSLEALPVLAAALEDSQSFLLCKARECLQDSRSELMKARILQSLNEDVKASKGGKTATFQRCFALKSGINDLMDVARKTYCELINDMHDHVLGLASAHSLSLKMNYTATKGYHIQITFQKSNPIKNQICLHYLFSLLSVVLNDIRQHISYLYEMCESIAEVDLILSLAQTSRSHNYVRPLFGEHLTLKSSRHPILESITTCDPVSNDIEATSRRNLSIVTGPNMSGKSIYIRQVLLLQIMAQVGSYVPAENATFRITDRIFSHLNFDDSMENNASTLALEMQEMQLILSSLTATSLVALDELCRGTSVEEGTALAWTLCEELSQSTAFVFVTTHFRELTKLERLYPSIKKQKSRLVYTHRLLPGVNPVESYGLRLAENLNVSHYILQVASNFASQIRNTTQINLTSSHGDEAYCLAFSFFKLKQLINQGNFSTDDLKRVQSELKYTLEEIHIKKRRGHNKELGREVLENKHASPNLLKKGADGMQKPNFHSQKLCDYSSSEYDPSSDLLMVNKFGDTIVKKPSTFPKPIFLSPPISNSYINPHCRSLQNKSLVMSPSDTNDDVLSSSSSVFGIGDCDEGIRSPGRCASFCSEKTLQLETPDCSSKQRNIYQYSPLKRCRESSESSESECNGSIDTYSHLNSSSILHNSNYSTHIEHDLSNMENTMSDNDSLSGHSTDQLMSLENFVPSSDKIFEAGVDQNSAKVDHLEFLRKDHCVEEQNFEDYFQTAFKVSPQKSDKILETCQSALPVTARKRLSDFKDELSSPILHPKTLPSHVHRRNHGVQSCVSTDNFDYDLERSVISKSYLKTDSPRSSRMYSNRNVPEASTLNALQMLMDTYCCSESDSDS